MLGLPLTYALASYFATDKVYLLVDRLFLSILVGALVVIVLAALNIFGSGLNATGTFMAFVLTLGASFYGLTIANFVIPIGGYVMGANELFDFPYKWYLDIFLALIYGLGLFFFVSDGGG